MTTHTTTTEAGAEVNRRAEQHMSTHGGTYQDAMKAILAADHQLKLAYGQPSERVTTTSAPLPASVRLAQGAEPGETVHLRTVALMQLDPGLTYQMAVHQVLNDDPALKSAYART